MATTLFLTHRLGPELYGQYSVVFGVIVWAEMLAASLLGSATVRMVAEADNWKPVSSRLTQIQLLISVTAAALLVVTAPQVAASLYPPELAGYIRLFATEIPFFFALSGVHLSTLIDQGAFGQGAVVTVVYWLSRTALMLILVGLGLSVTGAIVANVGPTPSSWSFAEPSCDLRCYDAQPRRSLSVQSCATPCHWPSTRRATFSSPRGTS